MVIYFMAGYNVYIFNIFLQSMANLNDTLLFCGINIVYYS